MSVAPHSTEARLLLLEKLTFAVAEAKDVNAALSWVLGQICETTGWVYGEVWAPRTGHEQLVCHPAWFSLCADLQTFRQRSEEVIFAFDQGLPGRAWNTKAPCWMQDVTKEPGFLRSPLALEAGLKTGMAIPILAGEEVVAVMVFFAFEARTEDEELIALVSAVAAQLGILIRWKRVDEALRQAHDELESRVHHRTVELAQTNASLKAEMAARQRAQDERLQLVRRLVTAQEEERRRVARELHDQMGQHLTGLMLLVKNMETELRDIPAAQIHANRFMELTDLLMRETDTLARELRPPALDDWGVNLVLERYVKEWSGRTGIAAEFVCNGFNEARLPATVEITLYRVVQEGLTNIQKHARARMTSVVLEKHLGQVSVILEDDGVGFNVTEVVNTPNPEQRLGLVGMKERLSNVSGTLEIESSLGSGTTLYFRIPLVSD